MLKTKWNISNNARVFWSCCIGAFIGALSCFFWWPLAVLRGDDVWHIFISLFSSFPAPVLTGVAGGFLFRGIIEGLEKLRFKRNASINDTSEFINLVRKTRGK